MQFVFRQQVQPWHPSSTLVHEAALAVMRLAPDRFWEFSAALFKDQEAYFDRNVVNEGRNETYRRLAKLAASSAGVNEDDVYGLLAISDKPDGPLNAGNAVTNDFKHIVRQRPPSLDTPAREARQPTDALQTDQDCAPDGHARHPFGRLRRRLRARLQLELAGRQVDRVHQG